MAPLNFVTPFMGTPLRMKHVNNVTSIPSTRCSMGDSLAPKISLKDTGSPGTSSISVVMEKIPPNTADAISIEGNVALNIALRSRVNPKTLPAESPSVPEGVSPVDFYFPKETRNEAPVISMEYNKSISVNYLTIDSTVGGIQANSVESIAFWETKQYKYSAPQTAQTPEPEVISTEEFEKYFPSKIRNRAPFINIKKPAGDWDKTAYIQVGNEVVGFNEELAKRLTVEAEDDEPDISAAATVQKYFGGEFLNKAPQIIIEPEKRVEFYLAEVALPVKEAKQILETSPQPSE